MPPVDPTDALHGVDNPNGTAGPGVASGSAPTPCCHDGEEDKTRAEVSHLCRSGTMSANPPTMSTPTKAADPFHPQIANGTPASAPMTDEPV